MADNADITVRATLDASGVKAGADQAKAHMEGLAGAAKTAGVGMSALGAATSAASGDVRGAAASMLSLARAAQTAGAAAAAIPYVALAVALATLVAKVSQLAIARRQIGLDRAFDNAAASARGLASAIGRINSQLERQASLRSALAGIASGREDKQTQIALANLERERQIALRGKTGPERAAIEADFDRRRANMEHDAAVGAATRQRDEMGAKRAENQGQIDALKEELAAAVAQQTEARQRALDARRRVEEHTNAAGGLGATWYRQTIAQDTAEAERYEAQMSDLADTIKSAGEKIQALEDKNTQLAAAMDAAGDDIALADANLGAALAEIDSREEPGPQSADGRGGPLSVSADRLARIGGYVGGTAPMKKTEDLLQKANQQRERLVAAAERQADAQAAFA